MSSWGCPTGGPLPLSALHVRLQAQQAEVDGWEALKIRAGVLVGHGVEAQWSRKFSESLGLACPSQKEPSMLPEPRGARLSDSVSLSSCCHHPRSVEISEEGMSFFLRFL